MDEYCRPTGLLDEALTLTELLDLPANGRKEEYQAGNVWKQKSEFNRHPPNSIIWTRHKLQHCLKLNKDMSSQIYKDSKQNQGFLVSMVASFVLLVILCLPHRTGELRKKGELADYAWFSPWFQSRESLRPLLQDGNARKPLSIIHFSLLEEITAIMGCTEQSVNQQNSHYTRRTMFSKGML